MTQPPAGAADWGRYYWCAKVSEEISEDGEIYFYADSLEFKSDGAVIAWGTDQHDAYRAIDEGGDVEAAQEKCAAREPQIRLVLAPGTWTVVFSASVLDGHAVAVQHWRGEVVR